MNYSSRLLLYLTALLVVACSSAKKSAQTADVDSSGRSVPVLLSITSPQPGEVITTSNVPVKFSLKNYEVQPDGQHIHVIVDNEPYQPCYNVAEPFVLKNIKPGIHTIRAFPARAWHESIKDPTAFATTTFYVEKKAGKAPVDFTKEPVLTYSRPKGKYEGEKAHKILFDFWLKNAELAHNNFRVRYKLDSEPFQTISEWKPSFFENLSAGKHKIVVELIDSKGKPVKGAYNHTEREFEVIK